MDWYHQTSLQFRKDVSETVKRYKNTWCPVVLSICDVTLSSAKKWASLFLSLLFSSFVHLRDGSLHDYPLTLHHHPLFLPLFLISGRLSPSATGSWLPVCSRLCVSLAFDPSNSLLPASVFCTVPGVLLKFLTVKTTTCCHVDQDLCNAWLLLSCQSRAYWRRNCEDDTCYVIFH